MRKLQLHAYVADPKTVRIAHLTEHMRGALRLREIVIKNHRLRIRKIRLPDRMTVSLDGRSRADLPLQHFHLLSAAHGYAVLSLSYD